MKRTVVLLLAMLLLPWQVHGQDGRSYVSQLKNNIVLGGGVFTPPSNAGGPYIFGGYYYEVSPGFYVGAHLEYSRSEAEVFGVKKVRTISFGVPTQVRYLLLVSDVSPYIGAAFGYSFTSLDEGDIRRGRSDIVITSSTAQGLILGALAGVMVRLSESWMVNVDGRYCADFIRTELAGKEEYPNVGGFFVSLGLQMAL